MKRVALAGCMLMLTAPCFAGTLTYNLSFEFSGAAAPSGPGPWMRATFDDGAGDGTVKLTMQVFFNSTGEFAAKTAQARKGWFFNFNPGRDVMGLSYADVTGFAPNSFIRETNNLKADGDGYFDFTFSWANGLRGNANSAGAFHTSVVNLSHTGGALSVHDFRFVSINGPVGKNGFGSAAHVQGISNPSSGTGTSGWVGTLNGDLVVVPLPTASGMGLAGVGVLALRRRRAAA